MAYGEGEVPVGAVVVKDGVIVGRGRNATGRLNDPTAHAEIVALREAASTLKTPHLYGATLYATLEPCPMCAGAAVAARIDEIVFGAHDEKSGGTVTLYAIPHDARLNHRCSIVGGVMDSEAAELLRNFFEDRRSVPLPRDTTSHGRA